VMRCVRNLASQVDTKINQMVAPRNHPIVNQRLGSLEGSLRQRDEFRMWNFNSELLSIYTAGMCHQNQSINSLYYIFSIFIFYHLQ